MTMAWLLKFWTSSQKPWPKKGWGTHLSHLLPSKSVHASQFRRITRISNLMPLRHQVIAKGSWTGKKNGGMLSDMT